MSQRKVILSMQVTLDGFVAGNNDEADWMITGERAWADLFADLEAADTFLLGRKMYPIYSKYWQSVLRKPDSTPNELKFAKMADKTQHIVFTKGVFTPDWNNTKVAHDPVAEVGRLKKEDGKNIIAWGGAGFAAQLIDLGLIDEFRFEINPTLLTEGKSLFVNLKKRQKLILTDLKTAESGLVILRYKPN